MAKRKIWPLKPIVAMLAAASASLILQYREILIEHQTPVDAQQRESELRLSLLEQAFRVSGYKGLSSSLLWLDFIQYYGDSQRNEMGYGLSDRYLTNMIEAEPRFTSPYDILISALASRSGQPERVLELIEHGLDHVSPENSSRAYVLPFEAGTTSFLYLGDGDAGRSYYELAADWYEETQGESAQHWRDLGNRLHNNPRSLRVQFDVWLNSYRSNPDPVAREFILDRLATLGEVRRHPDGRIEVIPPPDDAQSESETR